MTVLQNFFGTTSLTMEQWGMCLVPGIILLILGEVFKAILRARRPQDEPVAGALTMQAAA